MPRSFLFVVTLALAGAATACGAAGSSGSSSGAAVAEVASTSSAAAPATTPTPVPTVASTPPPTPAPTPRPTPAPTPRPNAVQTPRPAPTAATANLCGAPANPWSYTFCGGSTISSPPSTFCSVFDCIASFWTSTNGYVMECVDGTYSHSGGVQGSCSHHGGNWRALLQP